MDCVGASRAVNTLKRERTFIFIVISYALSESRNTESARADYIFVLDLQ